MQQLGAKSARALRATAVDNRADLDMQAWFRALGEIPAGNIAETDFRAWLEGPLRRFFPFEGLYAAYGHVSGGRAVTHSIFTSGHGPGFLASRPPVYDLKKRVVLSWWLSHRRSVMLDRTIATNAAGARISLTELEIDDIDRFSLGTVAQHAIVDPFTKAGMNLLFSGVPKNQSTLAALELIVPVVFAMHVRMKDLSQASFELTVLTDRQRDLAELAALGLSDKAIASRLGISENTVGNHFRAIYARLGIGKRSQLISLLK
jgi:DNA-binding CsgD family transcriptional regulator